MNGARLLNAGPALNFDGADLGGNLLLSPIFVNGEISIAGASIAGFFDCQASELLSTEDALTLNNSSVALGIDLRGLTCNGSIKMDGTKIGANLDCGDVSLVNPSGIFSLQNAIVTKGVLLTPNFCSAGTVDMVRAKLGWLEGSNSILSNNEAALLLGTATVYGGVLLDNLVCPGEIDLGGATVYRTLNCSGSLIGTLACQGMKADDLIWKGIQNPETAFLDLTTVSLKWLHDDRASWPRRGNLRIDGLVVEEIPNLDESRLEWVNCQSEEERFQPQPWMHLIEHLRDKGHSTAAKSAMRRLRVHQALARRDSLTAGNPRFAEIASRSLLKRKLRFAWDRTAAWLEEDLFRILLFIGPCWLLGFMLFWTCEKHFSQIGDAAYRMKHVADQASLSSPSGSYPSFNPAVYALENALPVIRLGQDDKWAPDPRLDAPEGFKVYQLLVAVRWLLILSGWLEAIVLVAALNARFRA